MGTRARPFNIGDIVCVMGVAVTRIIDISDEYERVKVEMSFPFYYWWYPEHEIRLATKEEKIKYTLDQMSEK